MEFQQFILNLDETDFKTPKKQDQNKSPNTFNDLSSSKKIKEEFKKNQIIKKLIFHEEQITIKQDGILGRGKRNTPKENKINSSYTLGLLNSIELTPNNIIVNKLIKPSDEELINQSRNDSITCKCRKSKCIKNYCVCSASNQECSFKCECYNCSNKQPKSSASKSSSNDYIGCNCRRQDCSKGYCECQKRKIKCTTKCNCSDECKNCYIQPLPFNLDSLS